MACSDLTNCHLFCTINPAIAYDTKLHLQLMLHRVYRGVLNTPHACSPCPTRDKQAACGSMYLHRKCHCACMTYCFSDQQLPVFIRQVVAPTDYGFVVTTQSKNCSNFYSICALYVTSSAGGAGTVCIRGAHSQPHQQAEGGDFWGGGDGHGGGPSRQLPWQGPLLLISPRSKGKTRLHCCLHCMSSLRICCIHDVV